MSGVLPLSCPHVNWGRVVVVGGYGGSQAVELSAQLLLRPFEQVPVDTESDCGVAVSYPLRQGQEIGPELDQQRGV